MSAFQAVNTTLAASEPLVARQGGEITPTTPRPGAFHVPDRTPTDRTAEDPSAKTPTRDSFGGISGQRPLPSEPFTPPRDVAPSSSSQGSSTAGTKREDSHQPAHTAGDGSEDVEMEDDGDGQGNSDNESGTSENRPSKKKKGQRFFCTDFPPCQLSFTRSEHLARHIRKHTGERPFQCHCSRRFSRLDNLRQHAQTVHVNEDIPGDSLAATGTRFQRQIRTDRVRPPNGRSRASTLNSQGGHSRGHSRNLSASSIASTASSISVAPREDTRRRPPPLAMAGDGVNRNRLSLDTYNPPLMGEPGPIVSTYGSGAGNQSPTGMSTPTSATFSTGTGSPRFSSGVQSPTWGSRTPGRRLSVPSGANPFHGPNAGGAYTQPYISPLPSSTASTFSNNTSVFASPTSSNFPEGHGHSRRESITDSDWRRRTWHPGTYTSLGPRPATSGLSYYQTPDAPQPTYSSQPAAAQTTRLPGIESFDRLDQAPPPPQALPRRQPSPMQIDTPSRPPPAPPQLAGPFEPSPSRPEGRPHHASHASLDLSLQRGITRLDIASPAPPPNTHRWSQPHGSMRPTTAPHAGFQFPAQQQQGPPMPSQPEHPSTTSQTRPAESPTTPRRNKRQAWYNGPLFSPSSSNQQQQQAQTPSSQAQAQQHQQTTPAQPPIQNKPNIPRTSPEDSSSSEGVPTPSNSSLAEYHPAIVHANGFVEQPHPHGPQPVPVDEQHKARVLGGHGQAEGRQPIERGLGQAGPPPPPPPPQHQQQHQQQQQQHQQQHQHPVQQPQPQHQEQRHQPQQHQQQHPTQQPQYQHQPPPPPPNMQPHGPPPPLPPYHPARMEAAKGYIPRSAEVGQHQQHQQLPPMMAPQHQHHGSHGGAPVGNDMRRLEALVAVATGEQRAVESRT